MGFRGIGGGACPVASHAHRLGEPLNGETGVLVEDAGAFLEPVGLLIGNQQLDDAGQQDH